MVDARLLNKTNKVTKRSASNHPKQVQRSKSKPQTSKSKNGKVGHQSADKDKSRSKNNNKGKKLKASQHFGEGKGKNIYTGKSKEENFLETINEKSFENVSTLKLNLLGYIFKKRLIKDDQYNDLFEHLVERFPDKVETIKNVLFEIVSTLDS